ncbi:MAG: hypothetical protein EHM40_05785 [Chloroflexi bacterium]|nr:MAG: hypothetical protein EHM40_05785 [Chloroflexota bacterium]
MDTQFTNPQKPTLVNVIAWMTLASGIVNLFWGFGLSITVLATIVGVVCVPFTILPTVLGIFEIIYAAKLLSNPPQAMQPSSTIAILEIVCVLAGNAFSVVVGILALVFYNDGTVRDYFARLNGTLVPVAPVPPVSPIVPAPVPEEEFPAPEAKSDETPEKPKRSRKVAGE